MKINTVAAIAALLTLTFRPAFALSFTEAAENLLLFEYSSQSADYCEQRGYPSRSIFLAWQPKYVHLQGESAKRILLEGQSRGLVKSEQDQVLSAAMTLHRKTAAENIAKKGIPCAKYRAFLDGYYKLLHE